jgi:hypothetical protein
MSAKLTLARWGYRLQVKAKVALSRGLSRMNTRSASVVRTLSFYRDETGWYIDLPNWPGPKGALAMVLGADTMLEYLGEGQSYVRLEVTERADVALQNPDAWLGVRYHHAHPDGDGAFYTTLLDGHAHQLWLCGVTEFVYGYMPKMLAVRVG